MINCSYNEINPIQVFPAAIPPQTPHATRINIILSEAPVNHDIPQDEESRTISLIPRAFHSGRKNRSVAAAAPPPMINAHSDTARAGHTQWIKPGMIYRVRKNRLQAYMRELLF